jgi:hypothetical protein
MKPRRTMESIYLGLAILGTALPLAAFVPWLAAHGLDLPRFVQDLFANRISAFFAWDVVVSALAVLVAVAAMRARLTGQQQLVIVVGTLLVGVSLGLPLLLLFQERSGTSIALQARNPSTK